MSEISVPDRIEFLIRSKWEELKTALKQWQSVEGITVRTCDDDDEFLMERVGRHFVSKRLRLEYDSPEPLIKRSSLSARGDIRFNIHDDCAVYVVNGKNTTLDEVVFFLVKRITG